METNIQKTSIGNTVMRVLVFVLIPLAFFLVGPAHSSAATLKSPPSVSNGLVGWWTFDGTDVATGKMVDRSGNANTGTFSGIASSTFYASGKIGQAGNFDGSDDRVSMSGSQFGFASGQDFTLSAWVKTNGDSEIQSIIEKRDASNANRGYIMYVNTNGTVAMYLLNTAGTAVTITSSQSVADGSWHHILAVYDRDGLGYLYIDGVLETSSSIASADGTLAGGTLYIGDGNLNITNSSIREFKGSIDDLKIYSRTFTAQEATQLYRTGAAKLAASRSPSSLSSGLVGHWTFDGKNIVNGVARDLSATGAHASLVSIATSTFYSEGVIGQAIKFDGTNDYVNIADNSVFDPGASDFSIALWVKGSKTISSFISHYNAAGGNPGWGFGIGALSGCTTNRLCFWDGVLWRTVGVFTPSASNWSHITLVRSGTSITGYVDGVSIGTATITATIADSSNTMKMGTDPNLSGFQTGKMDDVRYYNRTLSAQEILNLYALGQPTKTSATVSDKGAPASSLVGHWTFDGKDIVNGVVLDRSGNGNGSFPENIATSTFYSAGKIGQAGKFDGVNDLIQKATPSGFPTGNNPFSYSMWMNPDGASSQQILFYYGTNSSNQSAYVELGNAPGGCGANRLGSGKWGTTINCDPDAVTPGQWYHVSLVFDGTTANLYKNGVLVDSDATSYNLVNTYFAIGRVSSSAYFAGKLDDVRVYNRALTAAEVSLLYNSGR